jgi:hypothetical protein
MGVAEPLGRNVATLSNADTTYNWRGNVLHVNALHRGAAIKRNFI